MPCNTFRTFYHYIGMHNHSGKRPFTDNLTILFDHTNDPVKTKNYDMINTKEYLVLEMKRL
jgi:hypothetical protein